VFINGKVPKAPEKGEYAVTKATAVKWIGAALRAGANPDVDLAHFFFWYLPRAASTFWSYWLPGILQARLPALSRTLERFAKPWIQENDTSVSQLLEGYMGSSSEKLHWLVELSSEIINSRSNKGLITWSRWAADGFSRDGVEREKLRVIPLPLKPSPKTFSTDENWKTKRRTVLFVGLDYRRKGGDVVLRVMEGLKRELNDVKLIYVGKVPKEAMPSFDKEWIERYDFLERQKLISLYSSVDAFFMPTRAEAYGLSILEAMATGTPVVTTNVGAIPEVVTDGSGYLHDPDDEEGMMESLAQLLTDRDLNERVGKNGIGVVEKRHDPISVSKQVYGVYATALGLD